MYIFRRIAVCFLWCVVSSGSAQKTTVTTLNLIMPTGKGRIVVSHGNGVALERFNLYDEGSRPVLLVVNEPLHLNISYVLFPNSTNSTSASICRDDVVSAALRSVSPVPGFDGTQDNVKGELTLGNGSSMATGSYLIASLAGTKVNDKNVFGVQVSSSACAEIHVSRTRYTAVDASALDAQLHSFQFDPDYTPTFQDYLTLGSILFRSMKDYSSAAVYYQRALDMVPSDAPLNVRRVLADELAMSYGMSGNLNRSRAVNEAAIQSDPNYPLYYYNLACADAEQGKAPDAKVHLQQAFARKANILPGEQWPDPTQDDSIQKLKKDKEFWSWVQTLK